MTPCANGLQKSWSARAMRYRYYDRGMKSVLECEPDVIVMGADPPNFDCCQLLSEIKGQTRPAIFA